MIVVYTDSSICKDCNQSILKDLDFLVGNTFLIKNDIKLLHIDSDKNDFATKGLFEEKGFYLDFYIKNQR